MVTMLGYSSGGKGAEASEASEDSEDSEISEFLEPSEHPLSANNPSLSIQSTYPLGTTNELLA
jgi:hypothetical protein